MWNRIKRLLRGKRGFTLLESVLGLAILTLALTAAAALFATAARVSMRTQRAEHTADLAIALSERAEGGEAEAGTRSFRLSDGSVSEELSFMRFSAAEGEDEARLRRFVYPAEPGDAP